jgi:hypothetical protein
MSALAPPPDGEQEFFQAFTVQLLSCWMPDFVKARLSQNLLLSSGKLRFALPPKLRKAAVKRMFDIL